MFNFIILLFSLLCTFQICYAQNFILTGKVTDSKTNIPLGFVNIGIAEKGIGTVSDEEGNFTLNLKNEKDTVKFSMIGYYSKSFVISTLKENSDKSENNIITISLEEKIYPLKEVIISRKKFEFDTLGAKKISPKVHYYLSTRALGSEIGRKIKIKKAPVQLQNFCFQIKRNDYDSLTFRINVYSSRNNFPKENLLNLNIYFTTSTKNGDVFINLEKYNITVNEDFIIALEAIALFGEKKNEHKIQLAAEMYKEGLGRLASQDKWRKIKLAAVYFKVAVKYI